MSPPMHASLAGEVQSILGDIGPILLAAFRPHQMTGIGQKWSLAEASRNVRFPIPKLTFESTAASHNELLVGYVGFPAENVCLSLNSRRNQVGRFSSENDPTRT